jgi:hypothetical protein
MNQYTVGLYTSSKPGNLSSAAPLNKKIKFMASFHCYFLHFLLIPYPEMPPYKVGGTCTLQKERTTMFIFWKIYFF